MTPTPQQAIVKKEDRPLEFVPFGAADKIKLSIAIVQNLIAVPTKSGKTCSERDATKFMMMCLAKRLNPFEGDAFLIGYDGRNGPEFSLITAHQAFLKRAEFNDQYDGMRSGIIIMDEDGTLREVEGDFHLPDENVIGGWAIIYHKNRKYPCYRRIRMSRFNKGYAQWAEDQDPAGMICKCAEADGLRSTFPTMLGGLYLREELDLGILGITVDGPKSKPNLEIAIGPANEPAPDPEPPAEEQPKRKSRRMVLEEQARANAEAALAKAQANPPGASSSLNVTNDLKPSPAQVTHSEMDDPAFVHTAMQELIDRFKIPIGDFLSFLEGRGHFRNATACTKMEDIPAPVLITLSRTPTEMTKLIKTYSPPTTPSTTTTETK